VTRIVLLAVAAAWAAVLLPPLLRSRSENRPGSSVSDFNRQLSSLQRSVPTRGMAPMRSMSRPLTQSPFARPAAPGRPGQLHRSASSPAHHREHMTTASLNRRSHGEPAGRTHHDQPYREHRQVQVHRTSAARMEVRRRRTNVVLMLAMVTVGSFFLLATTHSTAMMYVFVLSFLSMCAYCYRLVQIRQLEQHQQNSHSDSWFRAA